MDLDELSRGSGSDSESVKSKVGPGDGEPTIDPDKDEKGLDEFEAALQPMMRSKADALAEPIGRIMDSITYARYPLDC